MRLKSTVFQPPYALNTFSSQSSGSWGDDERTHTQNIPSPQWTYTILICGSSPHINECSSQNNEDLNWISEFLAIAYPDREIQKVK